MRRGALGVRRTPQGRRGHGRMGGKEGTGDAAQRPLKVRGAVRSTWHATRAKGQARGGKARLEGGEARGVRRVQAFRPGERHEELLQRGLREHRRGPRGRRRVEVGALGLPSRRELMELQLLEEVVELRLVELRRLPPHRGRRDGGGGEGRALVERRRRGGLGGGVARGGGRAHAVGGELGERLRLLLQLVAGGRGAEGERRADVPALGLAASPAAVARLWATPLAEHLRALHAVPAVPHAVVRPAGKVQRDLRPALAVPLHQLQDE
mmetsp:Transcript_36592/g.89102  ORF Transcript_36592/g.89102 Transcript_36592/m.89102 type:complete len:267 (+) Transcript_36592:295-1095(+)